MQYIKILQKFFVSVIRPIQGVELNRLLEAYKVHVKLLRDTLIRKQIQKTNPTASLSHQQSPNNRGNHFESSLKRKMFRLSSLEKIMS